jgi:hypothetical protein
MDLVSPRRNDAPVVRINGTAPDQAPDLAG